MTIMESTTGSWEWLDQMPENDMINLIRSNNGDREMKRCTGINVNSGIKTNENENDPFLVLLKEYEEKHGYDEEEVMVLVSCPDCGRSRKIPVCKSLITSSPGGVYRFPVEPGMVCVHGFIAPIDSNFKSR
jgi:hypothetical protein